MKPRTKILAAAAGVLVAANLWQWWPRQAPVARALASRAADGRALRPEDFELKASPEMAAVRARRDLFSLKAAPRVALPKPQLPRSAPKVVAKAEEPPKSATQLAEENARAEARSLKVVGVVFRNGRGEAYIVRGEHMDIARVGEKVGGRFVVTSIEREAVGLRDTRTQLEQDVPVLGR